jgi:hypothetical protein
MIRRAPVALAGALALGACSQGAPVEASLPVQEPPNAVGFLSVKAAFAAARSNPAIVFSTASGWTVATDKSTATIWWFSPPTSPAHPSVAKRQFSITDNALDLTTSILCEAPQPACDLIHRAFETMDEDARRDFARLQRQPATRPPPITPPPSRSQLSI